MISNWHSRLKDENWFKKDVTEISGEIGIFPSKSWMLSPGIN